MSEYDNLPGNDHYGYANADLMEAYESDPGPTSEAHTTAANVQAALALAYEQRTANLLKFAEVLAHSKLNKATTDDLRERLGLEEDA